ncbi:MAG TPA: MlaA family lipoprotein [Steroidobacteraceae bacterium]|nr:MlaA family lipoprotein [Steroidobacteraceae bacterium]
MSRSRLARAVVAAIALDMAGCATLSAGHPAPRDPLERFNRSVFRMNTALDRAVFRPLARDSQKVPGPISTGIGNFVSNLFYPMTLANDLLQGIPRDPRRCRASGPEHHARARRSARSGDGR